MKVLHSSWHEIKPTAEDAAGEPRNTKTKRIYSKSWAKACNSSHAKPSLNNQLGTQMLKTATVTPLAMLVIGMILTKINGSIEE